MSDMKTCPFCREEIPVRAIKCRYCESMVDDIKADEVTPAEKTETVEKKASKREPVPPQQNVYYQAVANPKKKKNFLLPLIIVLVLLILAGAGAGYWFLWRDGGAPLAGDFDGDLVGSWQGDSSGEELYFQFLLNDMVNVAVPSEGYWFRTQYRIVEEEALSYLELYHRGLAEWERTAELAFTGEDTLQMTDTFDGIVINMLRIPDAEFREQINDLNFER